MRLTLAVPFPARLNPARLNPARLALALLPAALLLVVPAARAQFGAPPATQVHDTTALRPPAGSKVAIVEFEDLECPDCARAYPLLKEATEKYHIEWVQHDFPLPMHNWSFQAAVNARFFDTKSKAVGNDYREYIFANQISIETPADLNTWTQKFAAAHKIAMPFAVDPMGKFTQQVKADYALGQKIGIEHTPTIWVVTNASHAAPFVEVVDRSKLYQIIDEALAETKR
jgi:protein-disulfide isomerase